MQKILLHIDTLKKTASIIQSIIIPPSCQNNPRGYFPPGWEPQGYTLRLETWENLPLPRQPSLFQLALPYIAQQAKWRQYLILLTEPWDSNSHTLLLMHCTFGKFKWRQFCLLDKHFSTYSLMTPTCKLSGVLSKTTLTELTSILIFQMPELLNLVTLLRFWI